MASAVCNHAWGLEKITWKRVRSRQMGAGLDWLIEIDSQKCGTVFEVRVVLLRL